MVVTRVVIRVAAPTTGKVAGQGYAQYFSLSLRE